MNYRPVIGRRSGVLCLPNLLPLTGKTPLDNVAASDEQAP